MTMKTQARLPRSNENPVDLTGSYLESTFNLLQPSHSPHPQATEGQAHGHRGIGPWFPWWLPILHPRSKITGQFTGKWLWPQSLWIPENSTAKGKYISRCATVDTMWDDQWRRLFLFCFFYYLIYWGKLFLRNVLAHQRSQTGPKENNKDHNQNHNRLQGQNKKQCCKHQHTLMQARSHVPAGFPGV